MALKWGLGSNAYGNAFTGFVGGYPGMGYSAAGAGGAGNAYGGFGQAFTLPVGGYLRAPGAGDAANRRNLALLQAAQDEARRKNEARYTELVGTPAGLPTRTVGIGSRKIQQVQVGGRWVDADKVDPAAMNREIAQNSLTAPALGGYYGRYARAMSAVNDMQGLRGEYDARHARAMREVDRMGGLADGYRDRRAAANKTVEQLKSDLNQGHQDRRRRTMAELDRMGDLSAEYDERLRRNLGYIDQMGEQERKDINFAANRENSRQMNELANRGLTASTVLAGVRNQVERDRRADHGRLNDRLLNARLQTDSQLSGDALAYRDQLGRIRLGTESDLSRDELASRDSLGRLGLATDSAMRGDELNFLERLGNLRLNTDATMSGQTLSYQDMLNRLGLATDASMSGDLLRLIEGRTDAYPDFGRLMALANY